MNKGTKCGTLKKWPIDDLPKALTVIEAIKCKSLFGLKEGISFLLSEYPELKNATHQLMADTIICCRPDVTRTKLLPRTIK